MNESDDPFRWVAWARELITIAQTGLTYARDPYDFARYERIKAMAVEMFASGSRSDLATVTDIFRAETGHATPKVDVRALVLRDGRVLLVRERGDGRWSLPGGWADVGETPREAIEREVVEESGLSVRATRLLAVYDKRMHAHPPQPFYIYKFFFACEVTGGAPRDTDETDGVDFFPLEGLPVLSLNRVLPAQIVRLAELAADPGRPTDFD